MSELKQQVSNYILANPKAITLDIAKELNQPEGNILCALPEQFVRLFSPERSQDILAAVTGWGTFTTIIEKEGYIFEIKDRFPSGTNGYGYYNLNMKGDEGAISGHLKLDNLRNIAFVSFPFRGKESYHIAFIANNGETIFKIYLGRDENRQIFPEQIDLFNTFK